MKKIYVSVPSRGLRYLNRYEIMKALKTVTSFRPLTGIKVSEPAVETAIAKIGEKFPSPHGD